MDAALKFAVLVCLAALIVAANILFVRVIANWWQGGSLTIGTFVVVKPPKDLSKLDQALGPLLQAELKNIEAQIRRITLFANSPDALTISQPPIHPTDLSIKIGSVEVSGVMAWLRSLFISERTLNFVVSFDKNMALVAGDISALSKRQSYLHFEIPDPTPRKISSGLAYALYQSQMTETDNSEATALDPADFELVVETLAAVQELDRQALRKIVIKPDQYALQLDKIRGVTEKTPYWRGLKEAQASLAFAARRYDEARKIYAEFLETLDLPHEDRKRYLAQRERLKELSFAEAPANIVPRRDISALNADELKALRDAFKKLYEDNSNNGYRFIAAMYSPFGMYLQSLDTDKELMYLAWHRAYLAHFEAALRRVNPALSVPYWDVQQLSTLPVAVQAAPDNPLAAGPLRLISADGKVLEERDTTRVGGSIPREVTEQLGGNALSINDLGLFVTKVRFSINNVHNIVGGDMARSPNAAFDPLFWFLYANADRLWDLWQAKHRNIEIPDSVLDQKLEPFGKTVRDVLNTEKLGYKY